MKAPTFKSHLRALAGFAAAAIATACFVQSQPAAPPPGQPPGPKGQAGDPEDPNGTYGYQQQARGSGLANGEYLCTFTVSTYRYSPFACIVYTRRDGRQVLEKVSGSQRIHGVIEPRGEGETEFRGTYFCPYGDCTEEVTGTFVQTSQTAYRGTIYKRTGSPMVKVDLQYMPGGLGKAYGGLAYGAYRYGGYRYGGYRYGGYRR